MSLATNQPLNNILQQDKAALLKIVSQGIDGAIVREMVRSQPNYRNILVSALGTTSSNLSRLYNKQLNKQQSEEIVDFLKVQQQALIVFEQQDIANEWLATKIPALGNEIPNNLLDTFIGRSLVSDALDAIRYGEFN